jgi:flavin-dependent dehydrogenase
MVSSLRLVSAKGRTLTLEPRDQFAIYSRTELGRLLRGRAVDAGAMLSNERVERFTRESGGWLVETGRQRFTVDFLVGADGATSTIRRRVRGPLARRDIGFALGWHIKTDSGLDRTEIKYVDNFTGYIWAFPRVDHVSYGIVTNHGALTPEQLKEALLDYIGTVDAGAANEIRRNGTGSTARATFYAAMIPALTPESWDSLSACDASERWALVGDAAGFVDPVTGEGIYYALKSAELLAQALSSRTRDYDELWRAGFGAELRRAAEMQHRFYRGRFAGASITERMVQFGRWHRGIRETLRDLVAGEQGYIDLKPRLKRSAFSVI